MRAEMPLPRVAGYRRRSRIPACSTHLLLQRSRQAEPPHVRQRNIDDDDVRMKRCRLANHRAAVAGLAHHLTRRRQQPTPGGKGLGKSSASKTRGRSSAIWTEKHTPDILRVNVHWGNRFRQRKTLQAFNRVARFFIGSIRAAFIWRTQAAQGARHYHDQHVALAGDGIQQTNHALWARSLSQRIPRWPARDWRQAER